MLHHTCLKSFLTKNVEKKISNNSFVHENMIEPQ